MTTHPVKAPRKLIEVALPLDAINVASAREKSIRHGHPSTLHLYWARRPLATARAVIFSQMVNDPSWKWELEHPGEAPPAHLKASWAKSRKRLFGIIEELVKWENTTNEAVLEKARVEIRKSWRETCEVNKDHPDAATLFDPEKLPAFHDPFAGGGSIPLEAQRLGLEAYASDLNPVALLINKAMIEIPPKFAGRPPVNPAARAEKSLIARDWKGAQGLAEDVRYYGRWMRDEAEKRIGHLYPKVEITAEMVKERPDLRPYLGRKLTAVAWLWARTVKSPNPAFSTIDVPLASTFVLSATKGRRAYVVPIVEGRSYHFDVRSSADVPPDAKNGTKLSRGGNFRCVLSGTPISSDYIRAEGRAGRMGARMLAVIAEGDRERLFVSPSDVMERVAQGAEPEWMPDVGMFEQALGFRVGGYGLTKWSDLFTKRQLVALDSLATLVGEARKLVSQDAAATGLPGNTPGNSAIDYADALAVYLAFGVDKMADRHSALCTWDPTPTASGILHTFARPALPMNWDFAEGNPFSEASGNFDGGINWIAKAIEQSLNGSSAGYVIAADASTQSISAGKVVSTDPPYYDNIGYADLSDFFYVWLRRSLRAYLPDLFATVAVPKAEELVATPARHGGQEEAESFFLAGMTRAMHHLAELAHPAFPTTIYYAFKQADTKEDSGTASTGWDTFLAAVLRSGFTISGTWPMRTELANRTRSLSSNALASSVVLACRRRAHTAASVSRRQFSAELRVVLPEALDAMTRGDDERGSPVAPVDLSQAIIGPGMEAFSKYSAVLEADGTPMTVRTALTLINRFLADDDFDADTQFCIAWFEQHVWNAGQFGSADTLARAKGTSVDGVKSAGVLESRGGSVRLTKWSEYPEDWDPSEDVRIPVWEVLHHLIRAYRTGGEQEAGRLLALVQSRAEQARQLAYRLYTLCERAGRAEDARAYNEIITGWSAIEAAQGAPAGGGQQTLFDS
jgi:putative DNA methylase